MSEHSRQSSSPPKAADQSASVEQEMKKSGAAPEKIPGTRAFKESEPAKDLKPGTWKSEELTEADAMHGSEFVNSESPTENPDEPKDPIPGTRRFKEERPEQDMKPEKVVSEERTPADAMHGKELSEAPPPKNVTGGPMQREVKGPEDRPSVGPSQPRRVSETRSMVAEPAASAPEPEKKGAYATRQMKPGVGKSGTSRTR